MDQNLLKRLRDDLDIVEVIGEYVPLSKKGRNFVGLCPFHDDKNPSMYVSPQRQLYNCFSCGAKGDVVNFVARFEKITQAKAVSKLARRLGLEYDEAAYAPRYPEGAQVLISALADAAAYFEYALALAPSSVKEYLARRHLTPELCTAFHIGYAAPRDNIKQFLMTKGHDEATLINAALINERGQAFFQNRLVFGLVNEHGDVVGFSGRTLEDNVAKYINSVESLVFRKGALLYNFSDASEAIARSQSVFVCEGQMDVIALVASGIENAVAVMGTALTPEHLRLLENKPRVILNFDRDAAGVTATQKSLTLLNKQGFSSNVVANDLTKDIDELWREKGAQAVKAALEKQVDSIIWTYEALRQNLSAAPTPTEIENLVIALAPFWKVSSPITQSVLLEKMVSELKVPASGLTSAFTLESRKITTYEAPEFGREYQMSEARAETVPARPSLRYTHMMLKSMLKAPQLAAFYAQQASHVHIAENQLKELADYLSASAVERQAATPKVSRLISELEASAVPIVENPEEFNELMGRVNIEFYNYYIKIYKSRIKTSSSDDEINQIHQGIVEFKNEKEKIHNEE